MSATAVPFTAWSELTTSLMQRSDAGAQPENFLPTDPWLRDVELDAQWRRDWMVRFKSEEPPCESTVDELIGHGLHALAQIEANVAATTAMKRTSTCDMARTWYNHENHRLYGNAQAVAWGVSPLEVVAWLMHADSRYFASNADENDVFFHAVGEPGVRHRVCHYESKAGPGLRNRSFLNALVCKQLSDEPPTFGWATGPIAHYEGVRDNVGVVRAEAFRFLRLTAVNDHVARMEYVCWIDFKGNIPKFVIDALVIPKLMHIPISVQLYFFQIHVPTAPEAGTLIGHMLMDAVKARPHSEREAAIASFVSKMAVLRALRDLQFPHICAMLNAVICPTWRDHRPGSASNSPARVPVDSASNSPARAPVGSASNSPARALVGSGTSSPGLTPDRRFVVPRYGALSRHMRSQRLQQARRRARLHRWATAPMVSQTGLSRLPSQPRQHSQSRTQLQLSLGYLQTERAWLSPLGSPSRRMRLWKASRRPGMFASAAAWLDSQIQPRIETQPRRYRKERRSLSG